MQRDHAVQVEVPLGSESRSAEIQLCLPVANPQVDLDQDVSMTLPEKLNTNIIIVQY